MYAKKNSGMKVVATLLAIALLIGGVVGGTLAWLTATSGTVTNTFTVGDINITLQEYPFKVENGVVSSTELDKNATPVQAINTYKVVPGGKQPKEPFVTVKAKSESCYVYVNVVNNLTIDKNIVVTYNIAASGTDAVWEQIATKTDETSGAVSTLYRYKTIVAYSEADQSQTVFTEVSYSDSIMKDNSETDLEIGQLTNKTIEVDAYAHQSDNTDQATADAAAKAHFGFST